MWNDVAVASSKVKGNNGWVYEQEWNILEQKFMWKCGVAFSKIMRDNRGYSSLKWRQHTRKENSYQKKKHTRKHLIVLGEISVRKFYCITQHEFWARFISGEI